MVMQWFKDLSPANMIGIAAIVVPVVVGVVGGIIAILRKKDSPSTPGTSIHQEGANHKAIAAGGNKGNIAAGNINVTGVPHERHDAAMRQLGQADAKVENQRDRISQLEEELSRRPLAADADGQRAPQPTQEAKELAELISEDDGVYSQALKAIAEGNNEQASGLLDESQNLLDKIEEEKNRAQIKIYMARINNARYAGRPRDALEWCKRLEPLAGEDSLILNDLGVAYFENAAYQKVEPLMLCALKIDEKRLGKDHPSVATRLNNLAGLYQATNRLAEAEPLMERALKIEEASFGKEHPDVARALNNLAQLYQATNRLAEAEPLMERALKIDEASLGKEHPEVATDLNNLALLYKATNRLAEAEPLLMRAVAILESSLGPNHPNTITVRNNLTELRDENGDNE